MLLVLNRDVTKSKRLYKLSGYLLMQFTLKKTIVILFILLTYLSETRVVYADMNVRELSSFQISDKTSGKTFHNNVPIQEPRRFELYRSFPQAENIMKSPAFKTVTPPLDPMRFSVTGSYLDNLHANWAKQSSDNFDNTIASPLKKGQLELFLENSRRATLVLQILNRKEGYPIPMMVAALTQRKPGGFIWPIIRGVISSPFGIRWGRMHKGIDIAAPFATPIYASAPGIVISSGFINGYGLTIEIQQPGGQITTRYAHCGYSNVHVGQQVGQGDYIGNIGLTGNTTGPHLHFEIIVNNSQVDPLTFGI